VQNPDQYASILLNISNPNEHYTPEKIRAMYGRGEFDLKLPTPIPVNLTYQTAFVDEAGKLQLRADVYGRDATMIAMLKNGHGRDMETMVSRAPPGSGYGGGRMPGRFGQPFASASQNGWQSGPPFRPGPFFGRLFGPPMQPLRPPRNVEAR